MAGKQTNYQAYLLRCWVNSALDTERDASRFSLEDPHTGERFSFTGLESLVEFLRTQLVCGVDGRMQGTVEAEK